MTPGVSRDVSATAELCFLLQKSRLDLLDDVPSHT